MDKLTGKRIVTHSELQCAKDCMQKWEFRYGIGWRPRVTSVAKLFGTAIHAALEKHYHGAFFATSMKALKDEIEKFFTFQAHQAKDLTPFYKAAELAEKVFVNYVNHYDGLDFTPAYDPASGKLMVEHEFAIPVYTPSGRASSLFVYSGKVDLVIIDERGDFGEPGALWIVDHKSRVSISGGDHERLAIDQQARAYCQAMSVYIGRPIAGFIYNLIAKKEYGEPKINKNGELSVQRCDMPQDRYLDALWKQDEHLCSLDPDERKKKKLACGLDFDKYAAEIARLRNVKFFDRGAQRYSEYDMQAIQLELYQVSLMIHQTRFYYKNDAACDHWGGCSYRPLCMGLPPEEGFYIDERRHGELSFENLHPPVGRGYVIDTSFREAQQDMTMEGMLEVVNG